VFPLLLLLLRERQIFGEECFATIFKWHKQTKEEKYQWQMMHNQEAKSDSLA
jgi:predicted ArsR family transcriptional regulator